MFAAVAVAAVTRKFLVKSLSLFFTFLRLCRVSFFSLAFNRYLSARANFIFRCWRQLIFRLPAICECVFCPHCVAYSKNIVEQKGVDSFQLRTLWACKFRHISLMWLTPKIYFRHLFRSLHSRTSARLNGTYCRQKSLKIDGIFIDWLLFFSRSVGGKTKNFVLAQSAFWLNHSQFSWRKLVDVLM